MKISYNWIKDYLNFDLDPKQLSEILTNIGLEVEGLEKWESVKGGLKGVVAGEVLTCEKHPDADRLSVTTVDTGGEKPLHIVCGAPNVAAGQKVFVATTGTELYMNSEHITIKKSKIRGVVSEGMICAEDELGLGPSHDGIMVLDSNTVPGTPAAEICNIVTDYVYEIGLTPNRIDGGSHYGVARDVAAYLNINHNCNCKPELPSVDNFKVDNTDNTYEIVVENTDSCPHYSGITISNVTIAESPDRLKNKLKAIGLNPINNVVDITNFVQFEIGQPLHSFDADKIEGKKVIVKNLPDGTKFVTLDGVERELSSKDLMICNVSEGMCIGGVFGGEKSGISPDTKNIFLESACFNPVSIRKTSKRHGIQTDSSFRFERGVDPEMTVWALKRAATLIKELGKGEISSEIIDVKPVESKKKNVTITYRNINRLTGNDIDRDTVKKILVLTGFVILSEDEESLHLEIPSYRVDVSCEADVIEEILRIYGYNNITTDYHVKSILCNTEKPDKEKIVNTISDMLSNNGFSEIMCNSLNPSSFYEHEAFSKKHLVVLANPLSSDLNVMRQSLLFGGLSTIIRNINRQNSDIKLYEFGKCYFRDNIEKETPVADDFSEKKVLDIFISGDFSKKSWNADTVKTNFFHIKTTVEMVLKRLGINKNSYKIAGNDKKYYAEAVSFILGNEPIAFAGRISDEFLKMFDIEQDVYYAHIEWDTLIKFVHGNNICYKELPKYPFVKRDLALLINREVHFDDIKNIAFKTEKHLLRDVDLFDVYESESLGNDKKSYAVSFILRDDNNTLTDKNIDKVMKNLIAAFEKAFDAKIR